MKRFLLDTSALLTLRYNEDGAEQVAGLLYGCQQESLSCFVCCCLTDGAVFVAYERMKVPDGWRMRNVCPFLPG